MRQIRAISSAMRTACFGALLALSGCHPDSKADAGAVSSAQPLLTSAQGTASEGARSVPQRPAPAPPRVTLDGASHEPPLSPSGAGPRIYAKALRAWVFGSPSASAPKLGYLRAGASSPSTAKAAGFDGCPGGWFPVVPEGFVCAGATATTDALDPAVVATQNTEPDISRRLPYIYGTVRKPGPVYSRLPGAADLSEAEPDLADRMGAWLAADGEIGARYAPHIWLGKGAVAVDAAAAWSGRLSDPLPKFLEPARNVVAAATTGPWERMKPKVGYSLLQTFLNAGRRYGVTSDLTLVPIDRLRPIQGSSFHGVEIGKDVTLPFVFVRAPDAKYWEYDKQTRRVRPGGEAPYRAALHLTGKQQFFRGRLHFEVDGGKWLSDQDASRIDPAKRMPAWGKNGEKWLDINVTRQTLVAYDGVQPVFATLISSGAAGLDDPELSTATKRGIFRIHTKHITTTMASDEVGEEFELRDVPYVQYFQDGYALHGAYWHDRFGVPKSHGCINLAPEDARRLFYFTEPQVPPGWHGRLLPLKGTIVFVHA